jgi:hypothetical protein
VAEGKQNEIINLEKAYYLCFLYMDIGIKVTKTKE